MMAFATKERAAGYWLLIGMVFLVFVLVVAIFGGLSAVRRTKENH